MYVSIRYSKWILSSSQTLLGIYIYIYIYIYITIYLTLYLSIYLSILESSASDLDREEIQSFFLLHDTIDAVSNTMDLLIPLVTSTYRSGKNIKGIYHITIIYIYIYI
jgi:hypothetical protein